MAGDKSVDAEDAEDAENGKKGREEIQGTKKLKLVACDGYLGDPPLGIAEWAGFPSVHSVYSVAKRLIFPCVPLRPLR
jgi:hypothetical protein